jgi:membrane-bound lytic murein transglycosylase D
LAPVPNQPYFTKVKLEAAIDLNKAADLAKIDIKEVKKLNPGFRTHKTHPAGPHQILLPVKHAAIFRANFIADQKQQQANKSKTLVKTKVNVKPKVNAKPKTKTKKT